MHLKLLLVSDQVRGIDGTGGLGDVATGLAKELARRPDIEVRLLMPGYQEALNDAEQVIDNLQVPFGPEIRALRVLKRNQPRFSAQEPNVPCYLLQDREIFRQRENSGRQATLLGRAVVAFVEHFSDFHPDVIHCNDWHTGLIPVLLNTVFQRHPSLGRIATVYTTHNNTGEAYQGAHAFSEVQPFAGLPDECFRAMHGRSLEHHGRVNFAKGGLSYADLVNTVSLSYADELRTPAFGGGLEAIVHERASDLCGIVNGIDVHEWNPHNDFYLPEDVRFTSHDPIDVVMDHKHWAREALRKWSDPKTGARPFANVVNQSALLATVTRITNQKAAIMLPTREDTGLPHETTSPLERLCRDVEGIQIVVLGSAERGDSLGAHYVSWLEHLQRQFPAKLFFFNGFNIALSHLIYAASEMFLVPSAFEPCGLTQLTSMRYGSVPIVRDVGGLRDTVIDETEGFLANGFKFYELDRASQGRHRMADVPRAAELMYQTVLRALQCRNNRERWAQIVENGMSRDSSWSEPAAQYRKLYDEAVSRRVQTTFFTEPWSPRDLRREIDAVSHRWDQLLSIPLSTYWNLRKLATGRFGPFELTENFYA
ncbi:MAG TPA: glycogen/starch synthase, partial [Planctomycetaceae bacterium]|nr:glycogen/starch synthase [Planctomycetaceae bacterium]